MLYLGSPMSTKGPSIFYADQLVPRGTVSEGWMPMPFEKLSIPPSRFGVVEDEVPAHVDGNLTTAFDSAEMIVPDDHPSSGNISIIRRSNA